MEYSLIEILIKGLVRNKKNTKEKRSCRGRVEFDYLFREVKAPEGPKDLTFERCKDGRWFGGTSTSVFVENIPTPLLCIWQYFQGWKSSPTQRIKAVGAIVLEPSLFCYFDGIVMSSLNLWSVRFVHGSWRKRSISHPNKWSPFVNAVGMLDFVMLLEESDLPPKQVQPWGVCMWPGSLWFLSNKCKRVFIRPVCPNMRTDILKSTRICPFHENSFSYIYCNY